MDRTDFTRDAMLQRWLSPQHLDPTRIREDSRCRPCVGYAVVDHVFRPEALERLREAKEVPEELLAHRPWIHWLHVATDMPYGESAIAEGAPMIIPADHPGTQPDEQRPVHKITAYFHTNRDRRAADGGLLQIWRRERGLLKLVDALIPADNRAVLLTLAPVPIPHSISPNRKERRAFAIHTR